VRLGMKNSQNCWKVAMWLPTTVIVLRVMMEKWEEYVMSRGERGPSVSEG